jgi:hypothetical protein
VRAALALVVAAAAIVIVAPGCGGAVFTDRDRLKQALEEYNDGIRWGKVDSSCAHMPVAARKAFAERYAQLQNELEYMDYEVQRIEWDREKNTADVRVEMSWSLKRRGIVEKSVLAESWQEVRGGWLMTKVEVLSGSPLPLLDAGETAAPRK